MTENIRKLNKFGNYLADEARKISLYYFKKKIEIISKKDDYFDPVTIVDINIQKRLHKLIEKKYPLHSMLGEEESIIKDSEYEWCIDPIDGTKSFIQGVPLWGTLISLSKNGRIILGIADIAALDERYIGYENIAYKVINKKRSLLGVRKKINLKNAILNSTSPYVFASKSDQKQFEKIAKVAKSTRLGGDCYSYCLLADGHVDLVIESGLKPYDIRALVPIIKNSGGIIKSWEGNSVNEGGRVLAATNKKLFLETQNILLNK
tara:strand:+ start:505 stop:1293 length:789 start_codon:yes stop_codon:yes gene_type:complete